MEISFPLLLITWIATGTAALAATGPDRPNVFLILADDMSWRDCSPYYGQPGGHPVGAMPANLTPNMDTLAAEGMRFDRCFNATAMCAPLRQQLYTGIYPVRSGAAPNHGEVKDGTKSIVQHLEACGYRVGLMGKRHIGPQATTFTFEYLGTGSDTEDIANIAAANDFINRDPNEPYCLILTSNNPHGPWDHGDFVVDNTTLPVPADYLATNGLLTNYNKYLGEVKAFDAEVGAWMTRVDNGPNPSNTMFICLTEQGASLPGAKYSCYDQGLRTGCIIRWLDQVTPRSVTSALVELVDVVPTLIETAGGAAPSGVERLDGLSFLPVLLGATNQHKQYVYGVQTSRGVNFQPDTGYAIRSIRDDRYKLIWNLQYNEVFNNGSVTAWPFTSWVAVAANTNASQADRDHAQLLIDRLTNRPEFQFYDLASDPLELNNLIGTPAHDDRIAAMQTQLKKWMRTQRDRGILTEQSIDIDNYPLPDELHPYDAWTNQYPFLWHADRLHTADPDADLEINSVEWLHGQNPLVADSRGKAAIEDITVAWEGVDALVDLRFERPRHYQGMGATYDVQSSQTLSPPTWQSVTTQEAAAAQFIADTDLEQAHLQVTETAAPNRAFYRINQSALLDYTNGIPLHFSGATSPITLGTLEPTLDNQSLTLTVQATLPNAPIEDTFGDLQAEVLWKLGGGKGMSLLLMGDQIVFSGSSAANGAGALNLVETLAPSDFGKNIAIRLSLEHKVSSTLFELSGSVTGGGHFVTSAIQIYTGYIGSADAKVGDRNGNVTGLDGTAFGPLIMLPDGKDDVLSWSTGMIQYEIIGGVAGAL